ncbi:hypothetical protein MIMGU_mgv1a016071mg [Erythranthe guttata]|uniref:Cytochrome b5 heme-binding domain-containing protein n=1 Tax=Erythranthe guttata TaxID=4155 RepID=A0A022REQ5_ERYGU|nr:PREDICTED: cytochrome B5 isoform C [Erythranthe guttata]EYU38867.1 hypothetical protein MIMGU_mgv1a016071mg [Erythranthe guttata]|eukprot:XP_012835608.1 PREDICTED: cytochrome B5 isoform C [Erythranthe guttata]
MAEKVVHVHAFEDVAKHNNKDDCWLIINAKVYDVTPFLEEHPGGDEILYMSTGKDATSDFEDVGHSKEAEEKMKEFLIGDFDVSTLTYPSNTNTPPTIASSTPPNHESSSSKILLFILPLLILGVAFLLRFYSKN